MKTEKEKTKIVYGLGGFLSDLLVLGLIILICELLGCHVCSFVGERIGSGVKAYQEATK